MSRQPRLNIAEGVYHVTQRGLERSDNVLNDTLLFAVESASKVSPP